ncbi:MAG: DUF4169 family protein [Alphaproteobacteria bacterium]|nr:DUF4169 family protein [Alphaproteobacteria bacterium]
MGDVINLTAYRKARARKERARGAATSRLKHGTAPVLLNREADARARLERMLDHARLADEAEPPPPAPTDKPKGV